MGTPRLNWDYLAEAQAGAEVVFNVQQLWNEVFAIRSALNRTNTPPSSPLAGDVYIVSTFPTGVWSGKANNIAVYANGSWYFTPPKTGMQFWNENTSTRWRYSGGWIDTTAV